MVSIQVTRREVVIRLRGWDKVLAMRGTLRIPLSHVRQVRARPEEGRFDDVIVDTWRGMGTYFPFKLAAGVVHLADGPSFYSVRHPERAIALDLDGEAMRHVVLEIDGESPESVVQRIELALGG
jgi:hypothetical protein